MMSKAPPVFCEWNGEAFVPAGRHWARIADEHFVVGERYRLVDEAERSSVSHNHEFVFLTEAWNSLPDELHAQYPNPEVLRKHGLIAKGYCTMVQHVCPTKAEADRLAVILRPYDQYAIVVARGNVVTVYTAASQSRRAMGAAQFQQSKQALMEFVGDLLGVDPRAVGQVERAA